MSKSAKMSHLAPAGASAARCFSGFLTSDDALEKA